MNNEGAPRGGDHSTTGATSHRKVASRQRATKRRTRPSPAEPIRLSVPFLIPPKARSKISRDWIARVSLRALMHHLLYARGVVPASTLELLRMQKENRENGNRLSSRERKMAGCGASLERLLAEWDLLFSNADNGGVQSMLEFSQVLISLGPSWSRSRELYLLDLQKLGSAAEDSTRGRTSMTVSQEHSFARRLVCALLKAQSPAEEDSVNMSEPQNYALLAEPSPASASFKVQVSIRVNKESLEQLLGRKEEFETDAQSLLQRMIVRHGDSTIGFNKRSHVVTICVRNDHEDDDKQSSRVVDNGLTDRGAVWMTLPTSIKGFRI